MVHDLREQVVSQRFEDLRQKMVRVATNLSSQLDRRASSGRSFDFIRSTSPQISVNLTESSDVYAMHGTFAKGAGSRCRSGDK
ncbi:hypothetical protein KIN20_018805 [Parelaphostrongylus tenuis]|uniref:Uncharacterized protein n=1 Tax=Parelaphostrongylus tenuis TaxID=148309 RepID=A0AAD5N7Y5_PARTN|nr:hypothetical protein KIN20_018805 [Parelaphostrongylus tenuis]